MYRVEDIANMFGVKRATVRGWLSSGKLKGERTSRKEGWKVRECDLIEFKAKHPKYNNVKSFKGENAYLKLLARLEVYEYLRDLIDDEIAWVEYEMKALKGKDQ